MSGDRAPAAHVVTVGGAPFAAGEDSDGQLVARALGAEGLPIASRQFVEEEEGAIESALGPALARRDLVVMLAPSAGSGADLAVRVVCRLFGARLVPSARFLELTEHARASRGQPMPRRMDRLALLPEGTQVWAAPAGGEPGWALEGQRGAIAVLPAGSAQLGALVDQHLRPLAGRHLGPEVRLVRTLRATGIGPAEAEDRLSSWRGREADVAVSCSPVDGDVWVRLVARGASRSAAAATLAPVEAEVVAALGPDCYGRDDETLEEVVGRLLVARGLTLSVAESCTGGLLGHRITGVSGSSRYFERGVLVYSNTAKQELIGVPESLLRAHGAVSAPVAEAMVTGVARLARSDCALAITGIAGPDGGTPEKPVGTVFVGVLSPAGLAVRHFRFAGGRDAVKWQSTQAALDMLRRSLLAHPPGPPGGRAG